MNPTQFQIVALDILRNYWRIKAASALYALSPEIAKRDLEYTNVPSVGVATNLFAIEPGPDAMATLQNFVDLRLPRDLLFALIAEFECRLVARLSALAEPTTGTFGKLQVRIQTKLTIGNVLTKELDEIRERRNAMIHNGDKANARYVAATAAVLPHPHRYVASAVIGDNVNPSPVYLTYATDVLVRYSNAIG